MCHGDGYLFEAILWNRMECDLCERKGMVSQKTRMEYVRRFKDAEN